MGRRKRKVVSYKAERKLPAMFSCPACGQMAMKVTKMDKVCGHATIKCSNPECLLEERLDAGPLTEPADVYGDLVDKYHESSGGS
jgi:transcription elongation factor Elf1